MNEITVKTKPKVLDGHRLALLNNRFDGIVRAMANTLLKTARSTILNTARDFSCCILTANHEMLSMAESLPIHVMSGPDLAAKYMSECFVDLRKGDAFLHNSPYHGNSHAADWSILVPVIDDSGKHRFTVMSKAHLADCGNAIPTTYSAGARDVYEEGALIFPCVKVQDNYRNREDVLRIAEVRIRVPEFWHGDFLALVGAARIGERKLLELINEADPVELAAYPQEWFNYSERRMIEAIKRLPSQSTAAKVWHDPIPGVLPEGLEVKCSLKVDAEEAMIFVDLTDNPDCLPCGLNLTEATARTGALIGVFTGLGQVVPTNAGSFRRVKVELRDNCIVGIPRHPFSCSVATTNLAESVENCVNRAMAHLGDGYGMSASGKASPAATAVISGMDPRQNGRRFVNQLMLGFTGGAGGLSTDGWLTLMGVGAAGFLMRDSVEILELKYPILIHCQHIIQDSEGAGRYCGAPGARVEYGPIEGELTVVWLSDGTVYPPLGVHGGEDGTLAKQFVRYNDGTISEPMGTYAQVTLEPGERVISICTGGAGYGPPEQRDPARVKRDIRRGWVSVDRAVEKYNVRLDSSVNDDATLLKHAELIRNQISLTHSY